MRGNLQYENRINGEAFSLINNISQSFNPGRGVADYFQYNATLNYVYGNFEFILNGIVRPFTSVATNKYNVVLTVNYFPRYSIKKFSDLFLDHSIIITYKSATTGKPIKGVKVQIKSGDWKYRGTTDESGSIS